MAHQVINIGEEPDDGTGDHLRIISQKVNANFHALYSKNQPTLLDLQGDMIAETINEVRVSGYNYPGDQGAALWRRASNQWAGDGRRQSADGAWWEIAEPFVNVRMLGAKGDGVTDDTAAFQEAAVIDSEQILITDGEYLLAEVECTRKKRWLFSPNSVIYLKEIIPGQHSQIFDLNAGASGSVFEGGVLDGRRDDLQGDYMPTFSNFKIVSGIRYNGASNVTIKDMHFRNWATVGYWCGNTSGHVIQNVRISDSSCAAFHQYTKNLTINGLHMENIGSTGPDMYPPACTIRIVDGGSAKNITINGYHCPDIGNLDPLAVVLAMERLTNFSVNGVTALSSYDGDNENTIFCRLNYGSNVSFSGLRASGYRVGLLLNTVHNYSVENYSFDGEYLATSSDGLIPVGVWIRGGNGVYQVNPSDQTYDSRSNGGGRQGFIGSGRCKRFARGFSIHASDIAIGPGASAVANKSYGFVVEAEQANVGWFPNSPYQRVSDVHFHGVISRNNGFDGVMVGRDSHNIIVNGSVIKNNGQSTANGNNYRSGIHVLGSISGNAGKIDVHGTDLSDDQEWMIADGVSFEPGPSGANNQFTVTFIDPSRVDIGQSVNIVNAAGSGDITGTIVDRSYDDFVLQLSSSATFSESGNTTLLGNSVTTSGGVMTVTGGSLTTQIKGSAHIKIGSEWTRITKVIDDENANILPLQNEASGVAAYALLCDVSGNTTQINGIRIESNVDNGAVFWDGCRFDGVTNPLSQDSGFAKVAPGTGVLFRTGIINVNTAASNTDIISNIPENWAILMGRFQVTTELTDADGTISIKLQDSSFSDTATLASEIPLTKNSKAEWGAIGALTTSNASRIRAVISGGGDNIPSSGEVRAEVLIRRCNLAPFTDV